MPDKPEFLKMSLRVLEGDGFDTYEAAVNGATIVASKEAKADHLYNAIIGYAIEGRIREVVGATQRDMQAALEADFYVINNNKETFVKCTGKDIAEVLKEAVKRGQQSTTNLKKQIGFDGLKELTLRPITEYERTGKFQRFLTYMKNNKDEAGIKVVNALLDLKKFNVEKLFEFSSEIASARYHNIESKILHAFEKEIEVARRKKATGGFF